MEVRVFSRMCRRVTTQQRQRWGSEDDDETRQVRYHRTCTNDNVCVKQDKFQRKCVINLAVVVVVIVVDQRSHENNFRNFSVCLDSANLVAICAMRSDELQQIFDVFTFSFTRWWFRMSWLQLFVDFCFDAGHTSPRISRDTDSKNSTQTHKSLFFADPFPIHDFETFARESQSIQHSSYIAVCSSRLPRFRQDLSLQGRKQIN